MSGEDMIHCRVLVARVQETPTGSGDIGFVIEGGVPQGPNGRLALLDIERALGLAGSILNAVEVTRNVLAAHTSKVRILRERLASIQAAFDARLRSEPSPN